MIHRDIAIGVERQKIRSIGNDDFTGHKRELFPPVLWSRQLGGIVRPSIKMAAYL